MRRNKAARAVFPALSWVLALALLSGCAPKAAETTQKRRVALVTKSTKTEFWLAAFAGAQTAAAEYNLELTIVGPETEEDYDAQNQMIDRAVADGAEALVFSAIDFEENVASVEAAGRAGVKLVAIDSTVNSASVQTYIGTDNFAAGQMAAQAALRCGYSHINVGLLNYAAGSANGQERERGVLDALSREPNVTVSDRCNTQAVAENAQADTAAMLSRHPEINVLVAFNEPVSVGAARAVSELGLNYSTWLVGFDSNVETVDLLQTGAVDALIVQNPYAMGYLGVESAYKLLTGRGSELEPVVDTATNIVDLENMFTMDSQKTLFAFR